MRLVVLLLALFSLLAPSGGVLAGATLAGDHSPWLAADAGPSVCQAETPQQPQQQQQPQGYPGRYCCVHCRHNEVPCNGKCVAPPASGKKAFCRGAPGCACPGKP
jgi:hypothetical protein